jgi:hypothetical protein
LSFKEFVEPGQEV